MTHTLACSKDEEISKNNFVGEFPADRVPSPIPFFCCFITNTNKSSKPGEHWVVVFCEGGKGFFL